ncbi:MAG: DNA polymerase I, partial [Myxococcales bacterium]
MAASLPPPGADDVLYLVDISGYIFRSHHAISTPLTSPSGEPTSTTLGTVTMLQRMLNDQRPRLVAVAMDSSSQTFRRDIDPNYKAHRPPPPEDLKQQIIRTREILEAYRLPILQREGFEADDLIASAVRQARALKLRVVIVSADKDLMQLVGDDVFMWDTMRNNVFGPEEVEAKWRVSPGKLRDVLALMGDSSDNVPGVPHVGEKSAADLINTFGDIDTMYARIDEVKQKRIRESLIANRKDAELSRLLVTLKDDLEVGLVADDFTPKEPDREKLRALFTELNFGRLLASVS